MKAFEEWKLKRKCQKSGRKKEYQDYLQSKASLERDKDMYYGFLMKAEKNLNDKNPSDSTYKEVKDEVNRWKYNLQEISLRQEFIRPNSPEDIEYREKLTDVFGPKLASILGCDDSIRFHGTTIYYTREILKSGAILSSSARFDGFNKSTDLKDEISVSTANTIDRTLSFFTDLYSYQSSLPAGCLFVLRASESDANLTQYAAMKTFSFKEHPERLLGICTTIENIESVKEWLRLYGYDENLAYTFEDFLKIAPSLKGEDREKIIEKCEDSSNLDMKELIESLEDESINESDVYSDENNCVKTR